MAYLLGFITADGNVSGSTLSIDIQARDKYLLKFFISEIGKVPIEHRKDNNSYRVRFNSRVTTDILKRYNIIPNKSKKTRINFKIPKYFLKDYIRGVFDGDGWVYCRRNSIECAISSGSKRFLKDLVRLVKIGGKIRERIKKGKFKWYLWDLTGKKAVLFRDFIYRKKCMCLKRKKKTFYSDFYKRSNHFWTKKQLGLLKQNWYLDLKKLPSIIGKSYKAVSKKKWEWRQDGFFR